MPGSGDLSGEDIDRLGEEPAPVAEAAPPEYAGGEFVVPIEDKAQTKPAAKLSRRTEYPEDDGSALEKKTEGGTVVEQGVYGDL